jgi:hypothetical protein
MSGKGKESLTIITNLYGAYGSLLRGQHHDFMSLGGTGGVGGVGGIMGGTAGTGEGATMNINRVQNLTNNMYVDNIPHSFS